MLFRRERGRWGGDTPAVLDTSPRAAKNSPHLSWNACSSMTGMRSNASFFTTSHCGERRLRYSQDLSFRFAGDGMPDSGFRAHFLHTHIYMKRKRRRAIGALTKATRCAKPGGRGQLQEERPHQNGT